MSEFPRINVTWAMDNMLHDGALIPNAKSFNVRFATFQFNITF